MTVAAVVHFHNVSVQATGQTGTCCDDPDPGDAVDIGYIGGPRCEAEFVVVTAGEGVPTSALILRR